MPLLHSMLRFGNGNPWPIYSEPSRDRHAFGHEVGVGFTCPEGIESGINQGPDFGSFV